MIEVFGEVKRVLRSDGTVWLNLGFCYGSSGATDPYRKTSSGKLMPPQGRGKAHGIWKQKDIIPIPWMTAIALQYDGWYLRSDIIWHKPNCMPESVTDRPTKSHEYVFLLSKTKKYYYDAKAVAEPAVYAGKIKTGGRAKNDLLSDDEKNTFYRTRANFKSGVIVGDKKNLRDVWEINTEPYPGNHFAVMPTNLAKRCILAGCPVGGVVLDPFAGSGTVGAVAKSLGRDYILIEANPDYIELIEERIKTAKSPPTTLEDF
jgi:DNA modification methylase